MKRPFIKPVTTKPVFTRPVYIKLAFIQFVLLTWMSLAAAQGFGQAIPKGSKSDGSPAMLETALTQMDQAATNFRGAEADFEWDQYQKVVNETDVQKGKIYFRRQGRETQMSAAITEPDHKFVIFADGKIRFYQPRIEQITEYEAGKHRSEVESFLVMGFGGKGHDLVKSFDVTHQGFEMIDGVETVKLKLAPKVKKVSEMFSTIVLWIDLRRDISLKQQFLEPSGDYRIAHYTNIKINQKVPENVFKLNTTSKTKVVRPN